MASPQNKAKRDALKEWVKAVNAGGGFGQWAWDVAFKPGEIQDIITNHAEAGDTKLGHMVRSSG